MERKESDIGPKLGRPGGEKTPRPGAKYVPATEGLPVSRLWVSNDCDVFGRGPDETGEVLVDQNGYKIETWASYGSNQKGKAPGIAWHHIY